MPRFIQVLLMTRMKRGIFFVHLYLKSHIPLDKIFRSKNAMLVVVAGIVLFAVAIFIFSK